MKPGKCPVYDREFHSNSGHLCHSDINYLKWSSTVDLVENVSLHTEVKILFIVRIKFSDTNLLSICPTFIAIYPRKCMLFHLSFTNFQVGRLRLLHIILI